MLFKLPALATAQLASELRSWPVSVIVPKEFEGELADSRVLTSSFLRGIGATHNGTSR